MDPLPVYPRVSKCIITHVQMDRMLQEWLLGPLPSPKFGDPGIFFPEVQLIVDSSRLQERPTHYSGFGDNCWAQTNSKVLKEKF
mmetsp:Transcript_21694/g.38971  ORF Transcript_21694/g.38971 Transcript_21694/m.38971 type:complete len:84 (+) Transcript_21694:540-791(+)